MKITFSRDFSWTWPEYKGRVSTQYKAGQTYTVKRDCGDEAIAKGAAKEAPSETQKASSNKAEADAKSAD